MSRSLAKPEREEQGQSIDMTPMLDVVFIMLIFFIVTASFIKEPGADLVRPEAETLTPRPKANILIAVNANNEIWMNKEKIEDRAIKGNIERMMADNPLATMVIQVDLKATAEKVIKIMDAAKAAGMSEVAISGEEK